MPSFTIQLSSAQSALFLKLLRANPVLARAHHASQAAESFEHYNCDPGLLDAMLAGLEEAEAASPGVVHGFCL